MNNNIASESHHWYYPDGRPAYTIIGKNGKERPTTLRDAKKLGLLPSYSVIMKLYPKPALDNWKVKQGIMSALTIPHLKGEKDEDFITRILNDSKQQALKAREKGKEIHGDIEKFLQNKEFGNQDYILPVIQELKKCIPDVDFNDFEVEKSFGCCAGYGGKVDLHSIKHNFVCDFKTKEFDESVERLAWDEQIIQLHAYAHGLFGRHLIKDCVRLINIFVSTNNKGLIRMVEHKWDDYYLNVFLKLLEFWKVLKKF